MISLEQDGIMKALNGDTSLEEVYAAAKSQNED
jgi:type II secretory ATPase GspE/PulE/Tfp pilus assembly ATPase PilB-like protein